MQVPFGQLECGQGVRLHALDDHMIKRVIQSYRFVLTGRAQASSLNLLLMPPCVVSSCTQVFKPRMVMHLRSMG